MVFCGKPSKACEPCREKRVRCDFIQPACSPCIRTGKTCSGYRDIESLMFRDENAKVLRRVRAEGRQKREKGPRKSTKAEISTLTDTRGFSRIPGPLEYSTPYNDNGFFGGGPEHSADAIYASSFARFSPTVLESRGIAFFLTNYVSITNLCDETMDLKTSLIWSNIFTNRQFFDAVSSVGLAGLSHVTKNRQLMTAARYKHAETMKYVAGALRNIGNADLDNTLKAVMLLAIFEMINCTSKAPSAWGIHVDGAAALLQLIKTRGARNLRDSRPGITSRMQLQLCFTVFIRYFRSGQRLPSEILEWSQYCGESQDEADRPAGVLVTIISRLINLLHAKEASMYDPHIAIQEALSCEADLQAWEQNLPQEWKFEKVKATGTEENLYSDVFHIYRDLWSARIWNHYRWARILVNDLILTQISKLGNSSTDLINQQIESLKITDVIARDICDSIASHFQRHHPRYAEARFVPPLTGIFLLLSPLAVAGGAIGVPQTLHEWIISLLEKIGNKMGVQQALALIPEIRKDRARTGGYLTQRIQ
ncbi:hypothetical protein B0O99DRAFT_666308 [Bisporella sp. PMI_857]|nr:hypothetical protein B0O99DRAFT_666308 [Bisporella sp. PMI_857]